MKTLSIVTFAAASLFVALVTNSGCSSSSTTGVGSSSSSSSSTSSSSSKTSSRSSSTKSSTQGSSSSGSTTVASSGASSSSSAAFPTPPALGTQLDRLGRPAINTALNHAFDATAAAGTAKDTYNADSTPTDWATNYAAQFSANLGILDALDGVCGNQLAYVTPTSATSYGVIAGALADDRLYLNTAGTTDAQYLAVEANVLGVTNTDQGGRTLSENTLDTTYSVLAAGALTGVSNGITMNNVAFSTTFPYEAAPN